jgi:demethylmenaquinone methyltransferase / 2-methoxy-6-polyprenyl-1,4-benzoquinol methylase
MPENTQNIENSHLIEQMFDSIAHRYDLLNRILSFGTDNRWRRKLYRLLNMRSGERLLDLATGSGDILREFLSRNAIRGVGCDRSGNMLTYAQKKLHARNIPHELVRGDAFRLPFKSATFDVVTIGFGIRNMRPRTGALSEIYRVIIPGGRLAILEFFPRQTGLRGKLYRSYSLNVIPFVGKFISGSSFAYRYLPDSIRDFPEIEMFERELRDTGYSIDSVNQLTFGVVSIVIARKPA